MCISGVYLTTEDAEIADVARNAGATVIERPANLAYDNSSSRDVVLHALSWLDERSVTCESFVLLQPTSPLRTSAHIDSCITQFRDGAFGCAISVCEAEHHPARFLVVDGEGRLVPWKDVGQLNVPRQGLAKVYRQNGAIYLMRTRDFREHAQGFFLAPAMPFFMTQEDSVDIDTSLDFEFAKLLMDARR